jgi:mannose-6-phosphate isomerase-like protein (cupin superfamily)
MTKSIKNSEHYNWGLNCDGWHLLKTDTLSVIQERMPPGTSEREHYHRHSQQLFYVLAGVGTFELEGQSIQVKANQSLHIPRGSRHRISNNENTILEFLVISEPKAHGDREDT